MEAIIDQIRLEQEKIKAQYEMKLRIEKNKHDAEKIRSRKIIQQLKEEISELKTEMAHRERQYCQKEVRADSDEWDHDEEIGECDADDCSPCYSNPSIDYESHYMYKCEQAEAKYWDEFNHDR